VPAEARPPKLVDAPGARLLRAEPSRGLILDRDGASEGPVPNREGNVIVFQSEARNLVDALTPPAGVKQIYVWKRYKVCSW